MIYNEHNHPEIFIPRHITKHCLYTIQFILLSAIIAFIHKYYILASLQGCLYITSYHHWKKVKHNGTEKTLDISFVIISGTYGTYTSFLLPNPTYKSVWLITISLALFFFVMNEILLYYQVRRFYNQVLPDSKHHTYHYFSLTYTNPYTYQRELAYLRSTLTHGIFFHIFVMISSIICIVNGNKIIK